MVVPIGVGVRLASLEETWTSGLSLKLSGAPDCLGPLIILDCENEIEHLVKGEGVKEN